MQKTRLQQNLHNPFLAATPLDVPSENKDARVRALLQELHPRSVPEGAHVHPHWSEAVPVRLSWLRQGLPTGRQALNAPQVPPEHHLLGAPLAKD